jgi:hypothetical protein
MLYDRQMYGLGLHSTVVVVMVMMMMMIILLIILFSVRSAAAILYAPHILFHLSMHIIQVL